MKLILLCVWGKRAILGSAKTALIFKYEIWIDQLIYSSMYVAAQLPGVDYLAQVNYSNNCPTTFYCIFQLVWVPMTTIQNIKMYLLSSRKHFFFLRVPPLEKGNVNEFKGETLMKKGFSGAKKTHPDILGGGHRNPYQLGNAIKIGGTVFLHITWAK